MSDASLRIIQYQTILPPTIHYDCCCTEHYCSAAVSLISKDFPAIREVLCGHRDVLIRIRCNDDLIKLQFTLVELRTNVTSHHSDEISEFFVSFGSDDLIQSQPNDICWQLSSHDSQDHAVLRVPLSTHELLHVSMEVETISSCWYYYHIRISLWPLRDSIGLNPTLLTTWAWYFSNAVATSIVVELTTSMHVVWK